MLIPTVLQFRIVAALSFVLWLAAQALPNLGLLPFSQTVADARIWNYVETRLPYWAITAWWIVSSIATASALIGLTRFWPTSRWLLAGVLVGGMCLQPLLGLSIYSPFEASLGSLYGTGFIWLVTVSFWTPLAARFQPGAIGHMETQRN